MRLCVFLVTLLAWTAKGLSEEPEKGQRLFVASNRIGMMRQASVQKEIGLNGMQRRELSEIPSEKEILNKAMEECRERLQLGERREKAEEWLSNRLLEIARKQEDSITKILSPKQARRFRQLVFQYYVQLELPIEGLKASGIDLTSAKKERLIRKLSESNKAQPQVEYDFLLYHQTDAMSKTIEELPQKPFGEPFFMSKMNVREMLQATEKRVVAPATRPDK